jgi:hypothetical protein
MRPQRSFKHVHLTANFLTLIVLFMSSICFGQTFNNVWAFNNSSTMDMAIDANNNKYIAGYVFGDFDADPGPNFSNFNGSNDGSNYLIKLDSVGNFVYSKKFPRALMHEKIKVDAIGNVYFTGIFSSTADFNPGTGSFSMSPSGSYDGYLVKLDPSGEFQWAKKLGATGLDYFSDIIIDSAGNLVLSATAIGSLTIPTNPASVYNYGSSTHSILILKMDPLGNFLSSHRIGNSDSAGSSNICNDINDDILICGNFAGTVDFDPGLGTLQMTSTGANYFAKYSNIGALQWVNVLQGNMIPKQILTDNNSNILLATYITEATDFDPSPAAHMISGGTFPKAVLSKYSSSGTHLWSKELPFGTTGMNVIKNSSIRMAIDDANTIHWVSHFSDTAVFDINGQPDSVYAQVASDIYYITLNPAGEIQWSKTYGDLTVNQIYDVGCVSSGITITNNNQIYIAGDFSGIVDFNAGSQTALMTTTTSDTYSFLMQLDVLNLMADFNTDGEVNADDLVQLVDNFGCSNCPEIDINNDGVITLADVLLFVDLLN